MRTHEDTGHHVISSTTDHPGSRSVCFNRRWFIAALGFRWHHGGSALLQRCSRPNGRASLKRNPKDSKGLGITQQQAVDQLQVVQDQLVAQKAETKKLSEQIAALTEKLNALQVASAPTVTAPVSPPKR
jgi:uncharacterized coiled-coil protein SlyX